MSLSVLQNKFVIFFSITKLYLKQIVLNKLAHLKLYYLVNNLYINYAGFDQSSVQTPSFFFSPLLSHFPFDTLETLLNQNPLGTPMGARLRGRCMEVGVVHLILACISVFGHHDTRKFIPGVYQDVSWRFTCFIFMKF